MPLHIATEFGLARGKDMALRTCNLARKGPWATWQANPGDEQEFEGAHAPDCLQGG